MVSYSYCVMTDSRPADGGSTFLTRDAPQAPLPLASEGADPWIWESQFGAMLMEVIDGVPFVNGVRVERATEDPHPR